MITKFLKRLRESADIQYLIFTEGSCFKLYEIIKTIYPEAKAYWSDRDNHCITEINSKYYDIGGRITKEYIQDRGYYKIPKNQLHSYSLMKWLDKSTCLGVKTEKYKIEQNEKDC